MLKQEKGNRDGGNKLPFITGGDVEKFIKENFPPHGLSQQYEEDDLDEIEVVEEDGYLGLPPPKDEILAEDPQLISFLLKEKERLQRPREGLCGTF